MLTRNDRYQVRKWLEARRGGIGGSDVAAILGLSPWKTPLDVYLDKTGQSEPEEENEAMYWGTILEDIVAREFMKRTGLKVRRRNQIFEHSTLPFLRANIDRDIVGERAVLECKTTSGFNRDQWGEPYTDLVPFPYLCQTMHYMSVLDYDYAYMAVLIGGNDYRIYFIRRNAELEEHIIRLCTDFWQNHVVKGIPPEPTTPADIDTLYAAGGQEGIVTADDATHSVARDLAGLKVQEKSLGKRRKELEGELKKAMGDKAELARAADGQTLATWKSATSKRFDTTRFTADHADLYKEYAKESTYRRFLLKDDVLLDTNEERKDHE